MRKVEAIYAYLVETSEHGVEGIFAQVVETSVGLIAYPFVHTNAIDDIAQSMRERAQQYCIETGKKLKLVKATNLEVLEIIEGN